MGLNGSGETLPCKGEIIKQELLNTVEFIKCHFAIFESSGSIVSYRHI